MNPLPPLTPTYILRGHSSAIHSLHIFRDNLRLISGDADGWIVVWDIVSKRPVAVWKGHEGAILQVRAFVSASGSVSGEGAGVWVYSHGRDHKLRVWNIRPQDESVLQKILPVDVSGAGAGATGQGSQPWMVHSLPVNALNFCAFAVLFLNSSPFSSPRRPSKETTDMNPAEQEELQTEPQVQPDSSSQTTPRGQPSNKTDRLLAAPNALDSGAIDLFHLPLERRVCTVPPPTSIKPGMVMAVELFTDSQSDLYVASGYEDGHVMVFRCRGALKGRDTRIQDSDATHPWNRKWDWETLYVSRVHTQPVLSIDISIQGYILSSGADALLIKHPVPGWDAVAPGSSGAAEPESKALKTVNTKHAGQQGLRIRNDGKIFATAGWDSRVRVYSCKSMKELAVLKWHKEGCYAVAFASVEADVGGSGEMAGSEAESAARAGGEMSHEMMKREFSLATVQQQRNHKVQRMHWLAAGSKDGKISLWDIY